MTPSPTGPLTPGTRPRHTCGFCFEILDPVDAVVSRRDIVQCTDCQEMYHASCWNGHCQRPGCTSSTFQQVQIRRPPELVDKPFRDPLPFYARHTSTKDIPLGLSQSVVEKQQGATVITLHNNTAQDLTLNRWTAPVWSFIHFGDRARLSDPHVRLMWDYRGEAKEIRVYFHPFRPLSARKWFPLMDNHLLLFSSQGKGAIYYAGILFSGMVILMHVLAMGTLSYYGTFANLMGTLLTAGLVVGWLFWLMPGFFLHQLSILWAFLTQIFPLEQADKQVQPYLSQDFVEALYLDPRNLLMSSVIAGIVSIVPYSLLSILLLSLFRLLTVGSFSVGYLIYAALLLVGFGLMITRIYEFSFKRVVVFFRAITQAKPPIG